MGPPPPAEGGEDGGPPRDDGCEETDDGSGARIAVLVAGTGEVSGEAGESGGGEPSVAGGGSVAERGEGKLGAAQFVGAVSFGFDVQAVSECGYGGNYLANFIHFLLFVF